MKGTTTIQAVAKTLTVGLEITNKIVWAVTHYKFSITLGDKLSSTGKIEIEFPTYITPQASISCTAIGTIGTITSNPPCSYNSGTRTITVSGISSSTISAQVLNITVLSV